MTKRKVSLPKWQRWFMVPIVGGVWLMITFLEFFSDASNEKLGIVGYLIISAVLAAVVVMMWLMTSGKLPAYLIDDGQEDNKD